VQPDPSRSLTDYFYPPRTFPQSCISFPPIAKDVTLELNPDDILMLPKFVGFEGHYLFTHEFEEACSLIHMPRGIKRYYQDEIH